MVGVFSEALGKLFQPNDSELEKATMAGYD